MPNFVKIGQSVVAILRFVQIFKMAPEDGGCRHLGFLKLRNFIHYWGPELRDASACQFCQNRSIGCEYIKIFGFFKMAAAAILYCRNRKFSFAVNVCSTQTHHFLFADFLFGGLSHITLPNIVKICRFFAEILWLFEFSRCPPPPSWIFEIVKFYWLLGSRGWTRISMPNFVKIGQSVAKILRFFNFSRWRPSAIFDLFGAYLAHPQWVLGGSLSLCKIWLWSMQ